MVRRSWLWAIAGAALALTVGAVVLVRVGPFGAVTTTPTSRTPPSPSPPPPVITLFDLGAIPIRSLVAAEGALWTVVEIRTTERVFLVRVDSNIGAVRRVPFGRAQPLWVAAGFGAIWAAGCPHEEPNGSCPDGTVYRLDPTDLRISARARVGGNMQSLAAGEGAVWVGQLTYVNNVPQPGYLFRVDPETLALHRYSLEPLRRRGPPCCAVPLTTAQGAVWMLPGQRLVRLNLASGRFVRLRASGIDLVGDEDAVWLLGDRPQRHPSFLHSKILRIDPATNSVSDVGPEATAVAARDGEVWMLKTSLDGSDRTLLLQRLDPGTGHPTGPPLTVEAGPPKVNFEGGIFFSSLVHLAYAEGALWVTVGDSLEAIRIAPL